MSRSDYPDDFIDTCFYLWYEAGRKIGPVFISKLPPCESNGGRTPGKKLLEIWENTYGWNERADTLSVAESQRKEEEVIARRIEMFKRHEEVGTDLMDKGLAFLNNKDTGGIKSDSSAIRAIDLGIATRVASVGMAESFLKISKMSDAELTAQLVKLLGGNKPDSVDAELVEDDKTE